MIKYTDAGRSEAGFKTQGDCGIRAVAVACGLTYLESRKLLQEHARKGKQGNGTISRGIYKDDMDSALRSIVWVCRSAPKFHGRKARYYDMPRGRIIVRMARHYAAVIDGTLHDTWDSRHKMVYGYWEEA